METMATMANTTINTCSQLRLRRTNGNIQYTAQNIVNSECSQLRLRRTNGNVKVTLVAGAPEETFSASAEAN